MRSCLATASLMGVARWRVLLGGDTGDVVDEGAREVVPVLVEGHGDLWRALVQVVENALDLRLHLRTGVASETTGRGRGSLGHDGLDLLHLLVDAALTARHQLLGLLVDDLVEAGRIDDRSDARSVVLGMGLVRPEESDGGDEYDGGEEAERQHVGAGRKVHGNS